MVTVMDWQTELLFWWLGFVVIGTLAFMRFSQRRVPLGWLTVGTTILALALVGRLSESIAVIRAAAALWLLLMFVPSVLSQLAIRLIVRQRYATARAIQQLVAVLHPCDGWREAPAATRAMELASQGDLDGATAILEAVARKPSSVAAGAVVLLCRIGQRWGDLLAWAAERPEIVAREPGVLSHVLRAHGETGDLAGMVGLYDRERSIIDRMRPHVLRDSCRLMLFAYGGRPEFVERILRHTVFAAAPVPEQRFWTAVARWTAGDGEAARRDLEEALPEANPSLAIAIRRRLANIDSPPPALNEASQRFLEAEEGRLAQESRYVGPVSLRSARATLVLAGINLLVFSAQSLLAATDDWKATHDLGALCTDCVIRGEWWRVASSTVLHANMLHLGMNLFGLCALGPAAETALGIRRFLAVYVGAGLSAAATVVAAAWVEGERQLVIGASGAIMGVVGATAAVMLRGWLSEGVAAARNRGLLMAGYIAAQSLIDTLVPGLSFTTHLAGAVIGFLIAFVAGPKR